MPVDSQSTLEKIAQLNTQLAEKVSSSLGAVLDSLAKTKFEYTRKALLSFVIRSSYLIDSILSDCSREDIYSASILFRSLIEHNFKHLYITARALREDDDSVGKEYIQTLRAYEDLNAVKKMSNFDSIVNPGGTKWNFQGDNNKELGSVAGKFDITPIFIYLVENSNFKNEDIVRYSKSYLLQRLDEYTRMSSSVHGGSFGYLALQETRKDKARLEGALDKFVTDGFGLHKRTIETTYLFASLMDSGLQSHYDDVRAIGEARKELIKDSDPE